jgi:phage host-nuclease inhibitor protein Gam
MKSQKQLQEQLNNIIKSIDRKFSSLSSAMADGKRSSEKRYREQIQELERKREVLEWVLN